MQRLFLVAAVGAAMCLGASLPSFAATVTDYNNFATPLVFNVPPSQSETLGRNFAEGTIGSFVDTYQFTVNSDFAVDQRFTGSLIGPLTISGLQLRNSLGDDATVVVDGSISTVTLPTPPFPSFVALFGQALSLQAGTYYLLFTGNLSGGLASSYTGQLQLVATPIPGALALFGSAVIGAAGFARLRRRRMAPSAA